MYLKLQVQTWKLQVSKYLQLQVQVQTLSVRTKSHKYVLKKLHIHIWNMFTYVLKTASTNL